MPQSRQRIILRQERDDRTTLLATLACLERRLQATGAALHLEAVRCDGARQKVGRLVLLHPELGVLMNGVGDPQDRLAFAVDGRDDATGNCRLHPHFGLALHFKFILS
jgi:hypothetical protein